MPILLDFGIGHKAGVISGFETDYAQELGNLFYAYLDECWKYSKA